jgi:hypothetical protein
MHTVGPGIWQKKKKTIKKRLKWETHTGGPGI